MKKHFRGTRFVHAKIVSMHKINVGPKLDSKGMRVGVYSNHGPQWGCFMGQNEGISLQEKFELLI